MANNLGSNYGKKVAQHIAEGFEASRVTSKTVDTRTIQGMHNNRTGDTVYTKRPTAYKGLETERGDISGQTKNIIGVGQIASVVQDLITVPVEWDSVEEALELNQLDKLLEPMGEEVCNRLELRTNEFMLKHAALSYGDPGTVVENWSDIAGAMATMEAIGVPKSGKKYYQMNPYTSVNLAGKQHGLDADAQVRSAWENAMVSSPLAGMSPLKSNSLATYVTGDASDRAGALDANPDVTWATHKDSMIQEIAVTGFSVNGTISAGEIIEVTGRYHVNPATRQIMYDGAGNAVPFRWTVVEDVELDGSGEGTISVTNAAIFDAASGNQFDNVSAAPVSGDVITLLGSEDAAYQPSMFYHESAFTLATIQLPKLYATDVVYKSKDGLSMRMTRYSDGDANQQMLRVDLMYALGCNNPLFAGKGFGVST